MVGNDVRARPRGRAEVQTALIEASCQLFAHRLPGQVTVREIAAHANVNQGLVHEYFGSKDDLIKATVSHLATVRAAMVNELASNAAEAMPLVFEFQRQHPAFARLITWWLLEGRDIAELDFDFGPISRLVDGQYGPTVEAKVDQRLLAAAMGMLIFGSVVYRDYVDAWGLAEVPDDEIVAGLALLAAGLDEWNRAAD